ncbi:hypothetical protein WA026_017967 [Henosepilachna vigintioctopunctata]|uniref:Protein KRI1 homolog n=1 Tax=Henosepilachna vigintioctopunctata TaxID=420089 RepID=A0AAW1TM33_9CUCU
MSQLFEDSDDEVDIKINNEYAKNYDTWRKKEELNKLKTKYGETDLTLDSYDSSSSSEDDETAIELTEQVEKDFYKTLAQLKKKDPKIYDNSVVFFEKSSDVNAKMQSGKNSGKKTMFIEDYNRKLLLEKGGIASDSDEDFNLRQEARRPTYFEEVKQVKENITSIGNEEDSDNDDFLKKRKSDNEQKEKEEADYKLWLAGEKKKIDKETAASLKPLKEYWCDPNLDDGEKYLRDYILNERYLEHKTKSNYVPSYDEIVQSDENLSEDELTIEKQEEFEHKYNFRFEEPDQEFIKRYPRTMENSLRKEDNRRKLKRAETKERKLKEKAEKMEEIKKLKELKRKEIEDKIEKLKKITDNKDMAFNEDDIDGDFDPEAHDKRMHALFNDDFYGGPEEEQKPKLDLEDEDYLDLEIENYDNWTGNEDTEETEMNYEPHCEDDDFNMDADYDTQDATRRELLKNTKKKRKGRHKSKFAQMLASDRPKFETTDKKYEEYIDEYYKLDCEDIIDNIPCRFKYRKVAPNSFGLTIEEILFAKDRELNKWCSLKKAVQIRPDHVEKYDQIAFSKKGQNIDLKRKMIPSLFISEEESKSQHDENENQANQCEIKKKKMKHGEKIESNLEPETSNLETTNVTSEKANIRQHDENENQANQCEIKKKKIKHSEKIESNLEPETSNLETNNVTSEKASIPSVKKKKLKKKTKLNNKKRPLDIGLSDARLAAYGLNPKKFKNKILYGKKNQVDK